LKSPKFGRSVNWQALCTVAGSFCLLGMQTDVASAYKTDLKRYPDILPLSKVKAGMVGYGLTTFHANTISRFDIKVIGIIKNTNVGRDLILIEDVDASTYRERFLTPLGRGQEPLSDFQRAALVEIAGQRER